MAGIYRPRHPERTVLYRVLFHYFERFLTEYESRFEREYGYFRPIVKKVVEKYLDCGNPRCGFARIRCPRCRTEHLLTFSCKTRGFCPSCHAKRLEEWGEWIRETLLLDVPHRQVVFTIPKMLRLFFKFKRKLLGDLCRCAVRALLFYFQAAAGKTLEPGIVAVIQTFGDRINLHPHLHLLVTEGGVDEAGVFHKILRIDDSRLAEVFSREVLAFLVGRELLSPEWSERILSWRHTGFHVHSRVRAKTKPEAERVGKYMIRPVLSLERLSFLEPQGKVSYRYGQDGGEQETMDYLEFIARVTSHIPDKGQVTVRYYGLYANAHRGKVRKASLSPFILRMAEEDLKSVPSKGWAAMIRKVYEVDPMICPKCGGSMKVVAFITEYTVVDRIIDHLKLRFIAEKPPPSQAFTQVALMAADGPASRQFPCLDFYLPSRISFFRERSRYSHAQRDMIADNMEKEITINTDWYMLVHALAGGLDHDVRADQTQKQLQITDTSVIARRVIFPTKQSLRRGWGLLREERSHV